MTGLPKILAIITCLGCGIYSVVGEDLRLVGDLGPYEGRLEVNYAGEWGSICIDGWNQYPENAVVACRQLGFLGGSARPVTSDEVGPGRFWMDDVICQGHEDQLSDCIFNGWDLHNCEHILNQDVYLTCEPELTLRLIGGKNLYEGRLEIYTSEDIWVSVCIDGWTQSNSEVACRQIGLGGGSAVGRTNSESGAVTFWDKSVECVGNETRLDDCVFDNRNDPLCSTTSPVEIYLTCQPVIDGVLRLAGKGPLTGRLEVWYAGEWGTVCDNSWDEYPQNAEVACRQLGLSGGKHRNVQRMVNLVVKFWIDGLQCQNNERRLYDCIFNGWGNESCYHSLFDDVFLICNPHRDGAIRMVGGANKYEGRLEVYVAGEWGGVCINQWNEHMLNAHVACRQLGLSGGTFRRLNNHETGMGTFWMDNIECRGDEINLGECSFNGWGVQSCADFSNGVFLTCNPKKGDIQLVEGRNAYQGRVSMFLEGRWNFICGDTWTNLNAEITCRQLGMNGGIASSVRATEEHILHFNCNSKQKKLLVMCPIAYAPCTSSTVAFVNCYEPVPYGLQCNNNERCVGNAVCILSDGLRKCVCEDEEYTYWDTNLQFCVKKSLYGQVCALNISSCESNLRCQETIDIPRCACENDTFWSYTFSACYHIVGYNESCVFGGCESNLICLQFDNTTRCACNGDRFWNGANNTCSLRLGIHAVCDSPILGQCTSNLECLRVTEDMPHTCMCAGNDTFWDDNTTTCQRRLLFNETCFSEVTNMCGSNLICLESNNSARCLCENDTFWDIDKGLCNNRLGYNVTCNPIGPAPCTKGLMCRKPDQDLTYTCLCAEANFFWDAKIQTCIKQSMYNETCVLDVPDMCHTSLLCLNTSESSRCLCGPNGDQFWDPTNSSCMMKSHYNETCALDVPGMCHGNLLCLNNSESNRCLCSPDTDQFWDPRSSSCMTRLSYNELCVPLLTECMDGLMCHSKEGDLIFRCVCSEDGSKVWNNDAKQCQQSGNLAIYIPDNLNMMDAATFCDVEYYGRLASEEDFGHLFINCVEFVEDIWLGSNMSSKEHLVNDTCPVLYQDLEMGTAVCSQTHAFVCVIQDNAVNETCKDFPQNPIEPTTSKIIPPQRITTDRPGGSLIWWIFAVTLTLMAIGVVFMAIIFRRREYGYNEWKRRKSLLGTSKVVHNELYNPRALDKDTVPPSPAKSKIRKSLFTSSKRKKSTAIPPSVSSKEYDVSGNENPNAVYAVVKKKSMKRGKLNSSSSSVSENSMSPTPNVANVVTEKSREDPQPAKDDSLGETQFNFLYDSFLKSVANTNRDNTCSHPEPTNGKLGEG